MNTSGSGEFPQNRRPIQQRQPEANQMPAVGIIGHRAGDQYFGHVCHCCHASTASRAEVVWTVPHKPI